MNIKDLIYLALTKDLCVHETILLYLIATNDFTEKSVLFKYIDKCGAFSPKALNELVKKSYLEDFNSPGEYYPEYFMLTAKAKKIFATEEMAEEFWEAYPGIIFMKSRNASFVARSGGTKDDIKREYLKRIDYSAEKHKMVLEQIGKYIRLVEQGLINGHRIVDFVRNEIWDVIAEIKEESSSSFGKDL